MVSRPLAAILTVGTELTAGLRQDTNSAEIALRLRGAGYQVSTTVSLPDDQDAVSRSLEALLAAHELVVVTGGLGPTHDDITREAASDAIRRPLVRDAALAEQLTLLAQRHTQPLARERMLRQADVIDGAVVLPAATGTAPGQVIAHGSSVLVLLPGPPGEMRPLLEAFLSGEQCGPDPVRLRCTGITESDAQHLVQPALEGLRVDLTLLAAPGEVEVVLFPHDGDPADLATATSAARAALGDACFSTDGSSLAAVVIRIATEAGERIACAESCTGGLVSAALSDVAGASDALVGGVVAYSNEVKCDSLAVPPGLLAQYGAVSEEAARAMAEGALSLPGATIAVAVTGIAGPGGALPDKPVGLVWFAVARVDGPTISEHRLLGGDRSAVRRRATMTALDLLRITLTGP